jgi:peptidyl-tRNA hydrolase
MDEFARIKIGIGRDGRYTVSDWVLSKFQKEELEILKSDVFPTVRTKIEDWIKNNP